MSVQERGSEIELIQRIERIAPSPSPSHSHSPSPIQRLEAHVFRDRETGVLRRLDREINAQRDLRARRFVDYTGQVGPHVDRVDGGKAVFGGDSVGGVDTGEGTERGVPVSHVDVPVGEDKEDNGGKGGKGGKGGRKDV